MFYFSLYMTSEMEDTFKDELLKVIEALKLEIQALEKENKELKVSIQKLKNSVNEKFNLQEDDIYNLSLSINELKESVKYSNQ